MFDWERVGYGHPAIDLAIIIPGMGSEDGSLENLIAEKYLGFWRGSSYVFPISVQKLSHLIKLAKLWSAVEFIDAYTDIMDSQAHDTIMKEITRLIQNLKKEDDSL